MKKLPSRHPCPKATLFSTLKIKKDTTKLTKLNCNIGDRKMLGNVCNLKEAQYLAKQRMLQTCKHLSRILRHI